MTAKEIKQIIEKQRHFFYSGVTPVSYTHLYVEVY